MTHHDYRWEWEELEVRLSQAFSPAAPIVRRDFFRGRHAIVRRLINAANQSGQHAIIYGERGVGKTSLANVLFDSLAPFTSENLASGRFNCDAETTYKQIWNSLFEQVGIYVRGEYEELGRSEVFSSLRAETDRKLILIIDELDRVQNPDIDVLLADTIKTLSDFSIDSTLILVGVADDVDDLIIEHESINRCLVQIHLPRMTVEELREIVKTGIASVEMEISDEAVSEICAVSLGLPNYVHALGLASGSAAIDRRSRNIEKEDVAEAMATVIMESQQTVIRAFDMATSSPRRRNYYFQVLLACALADTDSLGYFRAADIRAAYSRIMGRERTVSTYSRHLHGLCDDRRGAVLQRFGVSRNYRFRFTDPILQPYVLMKGLERGLVDMNYVKAHSRSYAP